MLEMKMYLKSTYPFWINSIVARSWGSDHYDSWLNKDRWFCIFPLSFVPILSLSLRVCLSGSLSSLLLWWSTTIMEQVMRCDPIGKCKQPLTVRSRSEGKCFNVLQIEGCNYNSLFRSSSCSYKYSNWISTD